MPEMTAAEAAEWGKSLSFEKVWAALMETDKQIKTMSAEADKRFAESDAQIKAASAEADKRFAESAERIKELERLFAESAAQIKATSAEADKRFAESDAQIKAASAEADERYKKTERPIKKLSKNIGGVSRSLGKSTEYMFNAKMWEKFNELDYTFTKGAPNVKFLVDGRIIAEVNMFMENDEDVMSAEIETDLTTEDVDEHLERIKKIRFYMDRHNDRRTIVGAVAGAIVPDNVREYAQKKGLYVMVPSGKAVAVADMPPKFTPQKW
ncbi:MAG: hypothetical protein LBK66_03745 [Spirochaetaceae bacterium]|jgi:DNA repair exonuclease SbcCD ATPase subunit|nr:hypothetical protein [Spirochaetaceae bacterium]